MLVTEIATAYYNLARMKLGLLPDRVLELGTKRYAICHICPEKKYIESDDTCDLCGCLMKAKVLNPKSFCPAGHWHVEPYTVDIKDMKILQPGYRYILANKHVQSQGQVIQFFESSSTADPGVMKVLNDGTTTEEVMQMLIDRLQVTSGEDVPKLTAVALLQLAQKLLTP